MTGTVVWLTGLPSSGKSTLAQRTADAFREAGQPVCVLDGDQVRDALVPSPGYAPAERESFYATLSNLAALVAQQGLVVLVPATAHLEALRDRARAAAERFVLVHVDTPAEVCSRRDAKGLYAASEGGALEHLPGADQTYEAPASPDVRAGGGFDDEAVASILEACRPPSPGLTAVER